MPNFGHPGGFAGRAPDGPGRMDLAGHSNAFNGANQGGAANTYASRGPARLSGFHGSGGRGHR